MKIIRCDNFARDYQPEHLVAEGIDDAEAAEVMAAALNAKLSGDNAPHFYRVVGNAHKLAVGQEELAPPSQFVRAMRARATILRYFPQLSEAKMELARVLDESQNPPPQGAWDGTIEPTVAWKQFATVRDHLTRLLVALLFEPKKVAKKSKKARA